MLKTELAAPIPQVAALGVALKCAGAGPTASSSWNQRPRRRFKGRNFRQTIPIRSAPYHVAVPVAENVYARQALPRPSKPPKRRKRPKTRLGRDDWYAHRPFPRGVCSTRARQDLAIGSLTQAQFQPTPEFAEPHVLAAGVTGHGLARHGRHQQALALEPGSDCWDAGSTPACVSVEKSLRGRNLILMQKYAQASMNSTIPAAKRAVENDTQGVAFRRCASVRSSHELGNQSGTLRLRERLFTFICVEIRTR